MMTPDKANSLANDISCVIATLQAIADELLTAYPDNDFDHDDESEAKPEPKKSAVTLEQVRVALAEKSRDGFTVQVKALLKQYNADRLSAVNPSDYAALLVDAEGLGK